MNATMRRIRFLPAIVMLSAGVVWAAPSGVPRDKDYFPARYFADAAPVTAYDMVLLLPGFTVVDSDADVRGYGAALGNVLVDGVRPYSKRDDVADLLRRIPARSVDHIELLREGTQDVDMAGHSMLVNVVRRHQTGALAEVEAGMLAGVDGWVAPLGQAQYQRKDGERQLELSATLDPELDDDSGNGERLTSPVNGNNTWQLLEARTTKDRQEAAGRWQQALGFGRLSVNGAMRGEQEDVDTRLSAVAPGDGEEHSTESERSRELEFGARLECGLDTRTRQEWRVLQQIGWIDSAERSHEGDDVESFQSHIESGESIARLDVTHDATSAWTLRASIEAAYNFLNGDSELREDGSVVPLPGSRVRVEELRGETAFVANWAASETLVMELGLRLEHSELVQEGDSPREQELTGVKPLAAVNWNPDPRDQLRLSLSREIGQLDFEDFVASAALDDDQVTAGSAELEPEKTWRFEVSYERRFDGDASLTLGWRHENITDVIDRVLVVTPDDMFDAPGNIGSGRRDTFMFDLAAPLDEFGVPGGHVRASLEWLESEVVDPVTAERRRISGEKPVDGSVEFTQTVPDRDLRWGLRIEHIAERKTEYRYDQVKREFEGTGWTVFLERRLNEDWLFKAEATDLWGRSFRSGRTDYDGPRSVAPVSGQRRDTRTSPGFVVVSLRHSF